MRETCACTRTDSYGNVLWIRTARSATVAITTNINTMIAIAQRSFMCFASNADGEAKARGLAAINKQQQRRPQQRGAQNQSHSTPVRANLRTHVVNYVVHV